MPFQPQPNPFHQFTPATTRWSPANALALARTSDLAYEDPATIIATAKAWGFNSPRSVPAVIIGARDIQAFVMGNAEFIVVAFRGTISEKNGVIDANNWILDLEANQVSVASAFGVPGKVHDGFAAALATVWQPVQAGVTELQTGAQSVWITGHSLGAALALLAAAAFTFEKREPFNGLYTYGQPRVGDPNFCGNCDTHFGDQHFRFVNNEDIVTRVPPRIFPHFPLPDIYGHSGRLVYFDANGGFHNDEHYWNSFLAGVEVGFEGLRQLAAGAAVADHNLETGYIAHIQTYINNGCQPPMQW